jgi:hypothetical protein
MRRTKISKDESSIIHFTLTFTYFLLMPVEKFPPRLLKMGRFRTYSTIGDS